MQRTIIMPVANGVLPRPQGGRITGMFVMDANGQMAAQIGVGHDILVCPWLEEENTLYPVGVLSRVLDISRETAADEQGNQLSLLVVVLEGREHARWNRFKNTNTFIFTDDIEIMDLKRTRADYPAISGAGWTPGGGYTEFRGKHDIPVTLYGSEWETGREVSITANLGGLVEQEQAHTIEHAIIRALKIYGLCTPRTLMEAVIQETVELKRSVENSIRFALPEVLGRTNSGMCGNPMTNLAQFYLSNRFVDNLEAGKSLERSLRDARKTAMSQITQDLGLTMQPGVRVLQGLKKGMSHDDTVLKLETYKKVIKRFPFDPWS